jgi:AcrR family transcriptional regulator
MTVTSDSTFSSGSPPRSRRADQREWLLAGMLAAVRSKGYTATTIGKVVALARVSRPTFYEHFTGKEDCFLAGLAPIRNQLLGKIASAVHDAAPEGSTGAAVASIVNFASAEPALARMLLAEPLAGGRRVLDAREATLGEMARIVEGARQLAPASAAIPDLPDRVLLGATCRLLACRLASSKPALTGLSDDLLTWLQSYKQPAGEHRWCKLVPCPPPARSPFLAPSPLRAPTSIVSARVSEERLAEQRALSIMFATAEIVRRDGYSSATVAEIGRRAGVDGRTFYRLFADKQDAFAAATDVLFRHLMAVAAAAFAAGSSWPHGVWEAARALTQCVEQNSALAYVSLVESPAASPDAVRRAGELACAFTIFLQEGYRHELTRSPPSAVTLDAIAMTVFELVHQHARSSSDAPLSALAGHVAFIALAPFLGAAETNEFLCQKTLSS